MSNSDNKTGKSKTNRQNQCFLKFISYMAEKLQINPLQKNTIFSLTHRKSFYMWEI